jgi:hypothetical protein
MDGIWRNSCDPKDCDAILVMQPELDTMKLDWTHCKFVVRRKIFPVPREKFPVRHAQGKRVQHTGIAARIGVENRQNGQKS